MEPAALGSTAADLDLRLTDDDGFLLVSQAPAWLADFGLYPDADAGQAATLDELVEAQVAAVRTLFSFERGRDRRLGRCPRPSEGILAPVGPRLGRDRPARRTWMHLRCG